MVVRVRVVVSGRVQGVFFRARCADEARRLRVAGWVRNRADGRVEAVFEGEEAAVDDMVAWSRQGPPGARVERVETQREEPAGATAFGVTG